VHRAKEEGKLHKSQGLKFVVLGAGKTAMDSIVYLQTTAKVKPDDIAWVIPNDVWMIRREGRGGPWDWPRMLLKKDGNFEEACKALEAVGKFTRLDPNVKPTKFRFPVISDNEVKLLQKVKTIIRRGRATAIRTDGSNVIVEFGAKPSWEAFGPVDKCIFVHATSPGPFNGKNNNEPFSSDHSMTIGLLTAPPISSSMSTLAKIEAARRKGTLDLDFSRKVLLAWEGASEGSLKDCEYSENELLKRTIRMFKLGSDSIKHQVMPIITLAMVMAILDEDPLACVDWMKGNRLTFFSIPNFKCHVYEDMQMLCKKGKDIGFTENDIRVFELLVEKLKPLSKM